MGISSEHVPFIFERFYRAAPASSGEAQSGGLGLAIAQAIVRAQSGSIECESTPGVGSTFTVVLPMNQPRESAPEITPKRKLILR
jgi:signal transduction histidine kinase